MVQNITLVCLGQLPLRFPFPQFLSPQCLLALLGLEGALLFCQHFSAIDSPLV